MQKPMLSLLSLCSLVIVFSLTSCKKDSASSQDKIVGTWDVDIVNYDITLLGQTEHTADTVNGASRIQFSKDGTVLSLDDSETGTDTTTGTWSIEGSKLKLDIQGDSELGAVVPAEGLDIKQLTQSKMQLYTKQTQESNAYEMTVWLTKK